MKIDKQNGDLCFNESSHTYFNIKVPDREYISVTTLIHRFEPPFNKDFWSSYKALERILPQDKWKNLRGELLSTKKFSIDQLSDLGISEDKFNKAHTMILNEWEEENKKSLAHGTEIHAKLENTLYKQKDNISLKKFGIEGTFVCDKENWDLENGVYPEYLIYYDSPDDSVHIAGQIDLLIKEGDTFRILDWKTNKKINSSSFYDRSTKRSEKLLYPLSTMDNCNYNIYKMQLSTYAWMVEKIRPGWKCKGLTLVHYGHDKKVSVYNIDYIPNEVERMINFWKKDSLIQRHRKEHIDY